MTSTQLFFAILAAIVGLLTAEGALRAKYMDAKFNPIRDRVSELIQHILNHESRISKLEAGGQGS